MPAPAPMLSGVMLNLPSIRHVMRKRCLLIDDAVVFVEDDSDKEYTIDYQPSLLRR